MLNECTSMEFNEKKKTLRYDGKLKLLFSQSLYKEFKISYIYKNHKKLRLVWNQ